MRRRAILIATSSTLALAAATLAQPDRAQPDRAQPGRPLADAARQMTAETLRQRLDHRLDESRRLAERLERALAMLEGGAAVTDVLLELSSGEGRAFAARLIGADDAPPPARPGDAARDRPVPDDPEADLALLRRVVERLEGEPASQLREMLARDRDQTAALARRVAPRIRAALADPDAELRERRLVEIAAAVRVLATIRAVGERLGHDPRATVGERLVAAVREAYAAQFDARLAVHRREIAILEEKLHALRAELDERVQQRDRLIEAETSRSIRLTIQRLRQDERRD